MNSNSDTQNPISVAVFTLGCKTNYYEGGQILDALSKAGYNAKEGLKKADIFILNTCAVTKEAESKSRQAIARAKKLNPNCLIAVVGCASQKNRAQFADREGVVVLCGTQDKLSVVDKLTQYLSKKHLHCPNACQGNMTPVTSLSDHTRHYVKIQDGCNNFCSYCIVPYLRGPSRSRLIEDVASEVRANQEYAETVLIGIDISQYGIDNGQTLSGLANALDFYRGRIRLGSLYCDCITQEFCLAINKFCKHFHLSLQSGCDKTLASMNRHYNCAQYADAVRLIRKHFPTVAITTDIIVGFAGETEEDFEQTKCFVEQMGFADIHVFPYSPREGTVAYGRSLPQAETVKRRVAEMSALKAQLKQRFIQSQIERGYDTMLSEEYKNGYSVGYTDNYVKVYVAQRLTCNRLYKVRLIEPFEQGVLARIDD